MVHPKTALTTFRMYILNAILHWKDYMLTIYNIALSASPPIVALGMESGDIKDSQISSSTPWVSRTDDCSAEHSRLNYNDAATTCHAFAPNTQTDQGNIISLLLTPKLTKVTSAHCS